MAEDVKWIKFKVGMFDGQSFKRIKRAKIGGEKFRDKLTAVWFELMDLAGKCNHDGAFIDNREIPYASLEDIATMIDRETEELDLCMRFYLNEGMIEIIDDVYMLTNWLKYQNAEGLEKIRAKRNEKQARWREKKKALAAGADVDGDVDGSVDENSLPNGLPNGLPSYSYSNSNNSNDSNTLNSLNSPNPLEIEGGVEGEREGTPPPVEKGKKGRKKAEVQQPPADYSGTTFSHDMIEKVEKWLQYKTERRDIYQPTGLQSLISKIQNNANQYGEQAVMELIETCMASNWSGIIFDKLMPHTPQQPYHGGGGRRNAPPSGVDRILEAINRGDFDE